MDFLEKPLEDLLIWIQASSGLSWAWSIILLTCVVRIAILPLTWKQTRSMMAMQRLQPHLKKIQQKYKDDAQARNEAMMSFYKDNNVNPLASCLPLLVQLPIFLALFFVLKDFKAPAEASQDFAFLAGWVEDIRVVMRKGGLPAWILLVFYVLSQMFATLVMSTSQNKQQKYLFLALPVVFVPFVLAFPIGVMLYWITTNLWTIAQYLVITSFGAPGDGDVVMPDLGKGKPKPAGGGAKGSAAGGGRGGGATKGTSGKASGKGSTPPARRNKRRR